MKILRSFPILLGLLAGACTSGDKPAAPAAAPAPTAEVQHPDTTPKAKFAVHCFEDQLNDGSVISFQYTEYYEDVVGILDYTYSQKDGAHGTFRGHIQDNVITATWSYTVEGSRQQEEIMVKIDGDKAMKASGELTEGKGGVLRLKDPAQAKWEEVFSRVQCD